MRTCRTIPRPGGESRSGSTRRPGSTDAVDFVNAALEVQELVVEAFAEGDLHGEVWDELPAARAWKVVTRAILSAFYSHPWAWNEIGFGGPAYPRGYARIGAGQRESWESGIA